MEANTSSMRGPSADPLMTVSQAWESYVEVAAVDPVTMRGYESIFRRHIEPVLGHRPVADLVRGDAEDLLEGLRTEGAGAVLVRHSRMVLSILCRRAVALGVLASVPTEGVRAPRPAPPPTRVMTPEEFLRIREALPTPGARLLADLLVRSGLRLGEAFALMPADVVGDEVLVRRCVSEPGRRLSSDGQRYVLRPTTKNGRPRRVVVGSPLADRIRGWCAEQEVGDEQLVFPRRLVLPATSGRSFPERIYTDPLTPQRLRELGTFQGPNGLRYQHGTVNGYVTGRCREACCRQAISEYSAARRRARRLAAGVRPSRAPAPVPTGEGEGASGLCAEVVAPQDWGPVWRGAVKAAGLDFRPLARQTRHAHASWLNGGGVSVEDIADRLGHRDERSTRWYLRPVGLGSSAVTVLDTLLGDGGSPPR